VSRSAPLVAGLLAWVLGVACGGPGEQAPAPAPGAADLGPASATRSLTMRDISYAPGGLELRIDEVTELRLENRGTITHDFTVDTLPAELAVVRAGGRMSNQRSDVHIALDGGRSAAVRIRVTVPGEYRFYCSVAGHAQLGMEGTLTVR